MTDNALNALIRARQKNVNRYCRLLATKLTDHERKYIHKRIAEERIELERLISQKCCGRRCGHSGRLRGAWRVLLVDSRQRCPIIGREERELGGSGITQAAYTAVAWRSSLLLASSILDGLATTESRTLKILSW